MTQHIATAGVLTSDEVSKRLNVAMFSAAPLADHIVTPNDNGTGTVAGLRIFKAGTFKDSMGVVRTWTPEHLAQMVTNFTILRDSNVFPNVPLRADHRNSINSVVGYFTGMRTDGQYLYADMEFTEPEGFARFQRKTYRGRSAEVGFYESNDEALYWPTILGTAFVDVPAVEGLYSRLNTDPAVPFAVISDKESTKMAPPQITTFRVNGAETSDFGAVQAHIAALEANASKASMKFTVQGKETNDFAAVQTHITALETAATEQRDLNRREYVKGLVIANKLTAPQEKFMADLAVDMTAEKFTEFKASYDAAPVVPIFGSHARTVTNPTGESTSTDDAIQTAQDVVAMHRRGGMSEEQIKQTKSYQTLEALRAQAKA